MTNPTGSVAGATSQPDYGLPGALAQLQKNLPEIKKTETAEVELKNGGKFSYKYANLSDISAQILPLMGELGLSFTSNPTWDGDRFVLAYRLWHAPSNEKIEGAYPLPTTGTPQSIGSAITYARRYILTAVTGLTPEADDDAALAGDPPKTAQRTYKPRSQAGASARSGDAGNTAQRQTGGGDPATSGDDLPLLPGQRGAIVAMFDKYEITNRTERLDITAGIVRRNIGTVNDLTRAEAKAVMGMLDDAAKMTPDAATWLRGFLPDDTQREETTP